MLLNDNANLSHAGCQAVSNAVARRLGELGHTVVHRYFLGEVFKFRRSVAEEGVDAVLADELLCEHIDSVDAVLCNGEGSIHHGAGTELLAVLGAAQKLKKPTVLFNAVFQDSPGWESVLNRLDDFTVRDHRSLNYAHSLGVKARFVPDISLDALYSTDKPFSLEGHDLFTDWHPARRDVESIIESFATSNYGTDKFYLPFHSRDTAAVWRSLPAMLSDCRVLLTARHHGAYMAALAGCPFVMLGSNTHKMEAICDIFPGLPFCGNLAELPDAIAYATTNRPLFTAFSDSMASLCPLSHFTALGLGSAGFDAGRELDNLDQDVKRKQGAIFSDSEMLLKQRSVEFLSARIFPITVSSDV